MNLWCKVGLHRWSHPGGECVQCGYPDVIWDTSERAQKRLAEWKETR